MDIKLHKQHQSVQGSHWWFRVKDNVLKDLVRKYLKPEDSVLDFGCNYGHSVKFLQSLGFAAEGVDVSDEAINYGRSLGIKNIHLDKDKVFPPNHFDAVICLDVLEHIGDDKQALGSLKKVLKPGGYVFIMVPAFMFMWGVQDVISCHFRRYTIPALEKLAHEVGGFEVVRKTYFNTLLFPAIATIRLLAKIFPPKSRDSDLTINNTLLNTIFFHIFDFERKLLRRLHFPFGVSALFVLRKK